MTTKEEDLITDIFIRMETIMDLNGLDSVALKDVATICNAFCEGTSFKTEDVLDICEEHWKFIQKNGLDYD